MRINNAINAKLTFQQLDEEQKKFVELRARMILGGGGDPETPEALLQASSIDWGDHSEYRRYLLYSLAMLELNIEPVLEDQEWAIPSGKILAYKPARVQIENKTSWFRKKYNVDVSLDAE